MTTPTLTTAIDQAIAALISIGTAARAEAEDGYPESPRMREDVARAFAEAERVGVPEDVADEAYRRGCDWGEI
ncbi:hypothetical protein [Nocardia nova]|uniref:hypothetical protein n=1 Tax=Nocardia nova TaxID=37330 RepID=UPI001895BDB1|nr:hypothetical protein [Nocardia nova]MBF6277036.1 hypothetical protein [Nocardia nova]